MRRIGMAGGRRIEDFSAFARVRFVFLFHFHRGQDLVIARAVAVIAHCLATKLPRQTIKRVNRFNRVVDGAVTGLGNAVVDVALRRCQYMHVLLGADVHG